MSLRCHFTSSNHYDYFDDYDLICKHFDAAVTQRRIFKLRMVLSDSISTVPLPAPSIDVEQTQSDSLLSNQSDDDAETDADAETDDELSDRELVYIDQKRINQVC